jgi:hypothetical protein
VANWASSLCPWRIWHGKALLRPVLSYSAQMT